MSSQRAVPMSRRFNPAVAGVLAAVLVIGAGLGALATNAISASSSNAAPAATNSGQSSGSVSQLSSLPANWPKALPLPANGRVSLAENATLDAQPIRSVLVLVTGRSDVDVLTDYRAELATAGVTVVNDVAEPDARRLDLGTNPPVTVRIGASRDTTSVVFYLPL
jgi:hypothetical protein